MKTYTICTDLIGFFALKNELKRRGYIYILSIFGESRGANYVVLDSELGCFSTCDKNEYELNTK
jgi:hypothetical protein